MGSGAEHSTTKDLEELRQFEYKVTPRADIVFITQSFIGVKLFIITISLVPTTLKLLTSPHVVSDSCHAPLSHFGILLGGESARL